MSTQNAPIHSLRNECYACQSAPTRAYRRPGFVTVFTCEQHGDAFESVHEDYEIPFNDIMIFLINQT